MTALGRSVRAREGLKVARMETPAGHMIVAAVAEANECVIVTDNEKHFSGLDVLVSD
jgi:predicted nucleic acid-binding protein